MSFDTFTFFAFLAIVLAVYYSLSSWRWQKRWLAIVSFLFYSAWNPPFVLLLLFSTVLDWNIARVLRRSSDQRRRKQILWISVVVNLGLLSYFKYGRLLLDSFVDLAHAVGVNYAPPTFSIVLPIGISFYTFHTLSYVFDTYRRRPMPDHNFEDYALSVAFFSQLVAGPIVRAVDFLEQLPTPKRANARQWNWGWVLIIIGLFEKVTLSNQLTAGMADQAFAASHNVSALDAVVGVVAFSLQIFFDFSGYSLIAIGTALLFGFHLKRNFHFPYAADGFSDFWRRWHLSLSSWLRDYLYISLGGNRGGNRRTYINLMVTMVLGGLWHGGSWRFALWGVLHGAYLCGERLSWRGANPGVATNPRLWRALLVYALVLVAWIPFRADTLADTLAYYHQIVTGSWSLEVFANDSLRVVIVAVVAVATLGLQWRVRELSFEQTIEAMPRWLLTASLASAVVLIALSIGNAHAFIYFQF